MPVLRPFQIACLLICSTAIAPIALSAEKTLDRSFKVQPGGKLDVAADAGDIEVSGSSGSDVVVKIVLTGSQEALDNIELGAQQSGNDVSVTAKRKNKLRNRLTGRITVQVPSRYDVDLRTAGGDLNIERINGATRGKTSGGDIAAKQLQGNVDIRTSGGDVTVDGVEGDLTAGTSGGDISIDKVVGTTRATTSGGNVAARGARGTTLLETSGGNINAEVTEGKIEASTSGGNVRVALNGANQGISATTSGGTVELQLPRDVKATLDASTSGGTVRSDLATTATQKSRQRLYGTINGGGETIYARSSGGDVVVSER